MILKSNSVVAMEKELCSTLIKSAVTAIVTTHICAMNVLMAYGLIPVSAVKAVMSIGVFMEPVKMMITTVAARRRIV